MFAEVIGIGPFSKDIIEYLEYSEICYENTNAGAIVTVRLFGIGEGTAVSQEFAKCLGISNGWDFNQHKIDSSKVNRSALLEFVSRYTDYDEDAGSMIALLEKGFEFHFLPNG
jgi:hypothetical protein